MSGGQQYVVAPGGVPSGQFRVPGDKSISHRAVMLAALADGDTRVSGFLESADCLATMHVLQAMGVAIERADGDWLVHGAGLHGLRAPTAALDVGNSGTSMRLLAGLLAGQAFAATLTGDASLSRRPMARVVEPLQAMGAAIQATPAGTAPLVITGGQRLAGLDYHLPVASAQVKSCLLLAGLYARGETVVREPAPCRDHTERMLEAFGVDMARSQGTVRMAGGQHLHSPAQVAVPADLSSAAFFLVAAAITPGAEITLRDVGVNPTRTGVLTILAAMGADITWHNRRVFGAEPVADLRVRGGHLHGIDIDSALVPLAIDEFPALFVAAACADGETRLHGAAELRVKESDRIAVMAAGLDELGIETEIYADGIRIVGATPSGGTVASHGDHRIAMAFAVAGLRASAAVTITDTANVATSFPGFAAMARAMGLHIEVRG